MIILNINIWPFSEKTQHTPESGYDYYYYWFVHQFPFNIYVCITLKLTTIDYDGISL